MIITHATPHMQGNIAEMIYSAGPELYDFIYKTAEHSALDFIRFEFDSGQGFCGFGNVTVAVVNDCAVGTGCFFDGNLYNSLTLGTLKNMYEFYGPLKIVPILARTRHIGSVMKKPRNGELYLSNFGVEASMRSHGIGKAMIEHKIAEARSNYYDVFSLDVAETNPRAQSLYERLGLSTVEHKKFSGKREGISVPNSIKMELLI